MVDRLVGMSVHWWGCQPAVCWAEYLVGSMENEQAVEMVEQKAAWKAA